METNYLDSRTPEERANEPKSFTTTSTPTTTRERLALEFDYWDEKYPLEYEELTRLLSFIEKEKELSYRAGKFQGYEDATGEAMMAHEKILEEYLKAHLQAERGAIRKEVRKLEKEMTMTQINNGYAALTAVQGIIRKRKGI